MSSSIIYPLESAQIQWVNNAPYSTRFNDVYFSRDGGLEEACHVFIEGNDLPKRWESLKPEENFTIGEIGFGTGLNFLLTWQQWEKYSPKSAKLYYFSCEKYPLSAKELQQSLSLWSELKDKSDILIEHYPSLTPGMHLLQFHEGRINLILMFGDAVQCYEELLLCADSILEKKLRYYHMDAWFLDGFAPAKNKELWGGNLFKVLALLSKSNTTFATYSVAKIVKDGLTEVGYTIQKTQGFGSKREMLCGQFKKIEAARLPRHSPWFITKLQTHKNKRAIVIGGGLAGCFIAHALAQRGWEIKLLEQELGLAKVGSGNVRSILYPKLTPFRSPLTTFLLTAYLYALQTYKKWLKNFDFGDLSGILQLAYNDRERRNHEHLQEWITQYPKLGIFVNAAKASELTGVTLQEGGLFIPEAGWINAPLLCEALTSVKNIEVIPECFVDAIHQEGKIWHVNHHEAPVLILANGGGVNQFRQTKHLPLKRIYGQMSIVESTKESEQLKIPVCADGHVLPAFQDQHYIGATFHTHPANKDEDNAINYGKLKVLPMTDLWSDNIIGQWAGIRVATKDYLPIVGPLPIEEQFISKFEGLRSNPRRWLPEIDCYHEGLYTLAGFGSRGLLSIPLSAEWLASLINMEPSFLTRSIIQSFSPARFLRREILKSKDCKTE